MVVWFLISHYTPYRDIIMIEYSQQVVGKFLGVRTTPLMAVFFVLFS